MNLLPLPPLHDSRSQRGLGAPIWCAPLVVCSPDLADPDKDVNDLLDSTFASRYTSTPMSKTTCDQRRAPAGNLRSSTPARVVGAAATRSLA
jgi:hypothetical protein